MDLGNEVGGGGAVQVEEEGWVGAGAREGGEGDALLVPEGGGWVVGVGGREEFGERGDFRR